MPPMDRAMAEDEGDGSGSDEKLARDTATDAVAQEALARRLAPRVRRLSTALLRSTHDAEDATQLALLEIVRSAPSFRGESTLEAWADRISVRTAIRVARARRLASVRNEAGIEPDELPSPSPPSSVAEGLPRSILAYLDELPEARRTTLVLRHAMGYSIEEIAIYTGVSPNTVKDRLLAAREQVRKMVRRDLATGRRTS
jgi:RNA polymerase sigma-70 factor, ECF subfamily